VSTTKMGEAKDALERGDFERAFRIVEEAVAAAPDDPEARELYAVTHLAKAIRLSDRAREARRQELIRRAIDYDVEFDDTADVSRMFDEALAVIEDVLRVQPGHWKALLLKASLMFRRDRMAGRPEALEILAKLAEADPTNRQVPFTIRKIERPCARCKDTGFCSYCRGRGTKRFLRMESKCEKCYGRGICPACGVL